MPENNYLSGNKPDESLIWTRFQEGSEEALIYIYRKYASVTYNYGCQFTHDHEYVWDCVQDLFCELIKNRKKLGKVISIKGYLFKSLKRKIHKGLKKINQTLILDTNDHLFEMSISTGIANIDNSLSDEQKQLIEKYVNELPAHQREILLLYFYEGLNYQEIATIFETKVKSIRTMTYRALEKLSTQMKVHKNKILLLIVGTIIEIFY